jgi:cellulose synthase/poly-beta-1,6-N-acetylglucosamine synthase-like glycosyltransferase
MPVKGHFAVIGQMIDTAEDVKNSMDRQRQWICPAVILLPPILSLLLTIVAPEATSAVVSAALSFLVLSNASAIAEAIYVLVRYDREPHISKMAAATGFGSATAVIFAYLPNEKDIIYATVQYFLTGLKCLSNVRVILAYNSPAALSVEADLKTLAQSDPRFRLLKVADSHSKAANMNAVLRQIKTPVVGFFDADSRPCKDCFDKAWPWLAAGYDFVQGANVVSRSNIKTILSAIVSVEYLLKYLVSYIGRFSGLGVTYFTGSNGYWRTEAIQRLRANELAQVEDIDLALRGSLAGCRLAYDPAIVAFEDPPPDALAWWTQRVRWAQGWAQLSKWHLDAVVHSRLMKKGARRLWMLFLVGNRLLTPAAYLVVIDACSLQAFFFVPVSRIEILCFVALCVAQIFAAAIAAVAFWTSCPGSVAQHVPTLRVFVFYIALFPVYELFRELTVLRGSLALFGDPVIWNVTRRSTCIERGDEGHEERSGDDLSFGGIHIPERRNKSAGATSVDTFGR